MNTNVIRDYHMEEPGRPRARLGDRPRRAPARRLARITKLLLIVTLVIGAGLGVWEGYRRFVRLTYFRVAEIRVEGNLQVASEDVVASLGLTPETSLLELDLKTLSSLATQNPWIKEASVSRRLPLSLTIQVVERVPEAVFIADRRYLLSADGVILAELEGDDLPTLPILRAAAPRQVRIGERILSSEMAQGLSVWRQFQLANAVQGEKAHEIATGGDGNYVVNLGQQMPVIRLRAQDMQEQLRRLGAALAASGRALGEFVDVDLRFRDRVVFRPIGGR
ncbi:MAG TPA: FtsQ-type POTRA domain-containing protein [Candidatus Methylomirabilis sp.]